MSAQPVHDGDGGPPPLPRTQNAVAAALPPADRMEFYREMGEADETELLGVLRRWWLRARLYADPLPEDVRADIEAGTAPGRPAGAALRQAAADRETSSGER
ncbi:MULTISPECIES: hypothetical protein [Streptomyces]|uniref:Uncharacterized protein n=3 Tax=Streptomyces rimosus TaxID=1927 RepID=L8F0C1_STRR1|nr:MULTISPECIES: hypothetical protein [Streptomyces]KOG73059.1 hypothetical protein ADK78_17510 [Kitasatospora aureofaciens]MYT42092.1 hypothetical protein [Streptomyces sp. SID5471]KEF04825.1 hypothetical protein DF17_21495 [Streptomyces rimosus]KOT32433.1 hypothetical protein ADK84_28085 [Streptomyces sp. NRRL WC-3701]KOT38610.1 hypothetical protein ADK42_16790 [Streptomyces rimosus subsp. rimosus]